jgi:hypothetical protein
VVTPAERAARAVAVRGLLNDPNIQDAFASIEADLIDEWRRNFNSAERENLWRALSIVERLKVWMNSAASHDMKAIRATK